MSLKIGTVHGREEALKIIEGVPHFPEIGKKGKIKWQATIVCPNRLATFEDFEGSEEDLVNKTLKYVNKDLK